jgi:transcription initiation factor TFIID subunit 3
MSSASSLNLALLRPAIIQILRAVGFHSAKPSVVDSLTDITARYMVLLASRTASWAQENHNSNVPDITDVRMAMTDCGALPSTTQASEEVWREILRKPLEEIPDRNGLRTLEATRRDEEDTEDMQAFVAWFSSNIYQEIKRITGQIQTEPNAEVEDYLTGLYILYQ